VPEHILVIGGAGYIGSHVCKALGRAGYSPVTFDNLSQGRRRAVKWGPLERGNLHDVDVLLLFSASCDRCGPPSRACAYLGESMCAPQTYFQNNVTGTLALLDAMLISHGKHIIFSSTCAIFGIPRHFPIAENHPLQPVNPYGEFKLMIEKALRWYREFHKMRWASLRYLNPAGADPDVDTGEPHE